MLKCFSCNFENTTNSMVCYNCGQSLLQYDNCGISILNGSSKGQVIDYRYIIEDFVKSGITGSIYKAEDVSTGAKVIIRALPLCLDDDQLNKIIEVFRQKTGSHKEVEFEKLHMSGKVKYLVFRDCDQKQFLVFDSKLDETILESTIDQICIESLSLKSQALKDSYTQISNLSGQINCLESEKDKLKYDYSRLIDNYSSKTEELELKLKCHKEQNQLFEKELDISKQETERVKQEMVEQSSVLNQAKWKIEILSGNLKQAEKENESLQMSRNEVLELLSEKNNKIESLESQIADLKTEYSSLMNKAQRENKVVVSALKKSKQISSPRNKRYKIFAAVIFCGAALGIGSYIISSENGLPLKFPSENISRQSDLNVNSIPITHTIGDMDELQNTEINKLSQIVIPEQKEFLQDSIPAVANSSENPEEKENAQKTKTEAIDAEDHYLQAAKQGESEAMYDMGMAYLWGTGAKKDTEEGIKWLERAAMIGNGEANLELGLVYFTGEHAEKDYSKALGYFFESSNSGNPLAMYYAGQMYHYGIGIEQNDQETIRWYKKAAKAGQTQAMNQLAQMYFFGEIVEKDYQKSAEYYESSASLDDIRGMYNLAIFYQNGIGVETDARKAMLWLIKAARKGDADSMYRLGQMFENGNVINKNLEKARYWYESAAKAGHKEAQQKFLNLKSEVGQ